MRQKRAFAIAVLLFFMTTAPLVQPALGDQNEAQAAIGSAKSSLIISYKAVTDVENLGGTVDSLTYTLNVAADLLSKAELSYAARDYDSAYIYAIQSQSQLKDIGSQISALKENVAGTNVSRLMFDILSIGISLGLVSIGIAVWTILGRPERRKMYADEAE